MQIRHRFSATASVLVVLVTIISCSEAPAPEEPGDPINPLHGVWSMTEMTPGGGGPAINPSQPGLFIFTEGYYSKIYSLGDQLRPRSAESFNPTPEEKVAQYDTIIVHTGAYEVSGSTITFRPQVAKSPEFIGGQSRADFQINGDVITFTLQEVVAEDGAPAPNAPGSSMRLRRVE